MSRVMHHSRSEKTNSIDAFPPRFLSTAFYLLRHVLEGVREALLAEGKLADGPDLGILKVNC